MILSAPSGGGKTTIARGLLDARPDVGYSISCTTRERRENEVNGRDYHFLSMEEYLRRKDKGDFAESAVVHGRLYGTLRAEVERVLESGRYVIMDIDVEGARQFRNAFADSISIFVLPPSGEVLLERLRERDTESPESLRQRMHSALTELRAVKEYEYVIVNEKLEQAIGDVSSIIDAERLRWKRESGTDNRVQSIVKRLERELTSSEKVS
ncbi:MAG: guanylate kinase [Gemmatimonadaceae bacterium]